MHQVLQDDVFVVSLCLGCEIGSKTVFLDLIKNCVVDVSLLAFCYCVLKVDWTAKILTELALLHDCVQILIVGLPDLELDFKASSELVLDVLRTSEATEYTATNHNSHLG